MFEVDAFGLFSRCLPDPGDVRVEMLPPGEVLPAVTAPVAFSVAVAHVSAELRLLCEDVVGGMVISVLIVLVLLLLLVLADEAYEAALVGTGNVLLQLVTVGEGLQAPFGVPVGAFKGLPVYLGSVDRRLVPRKMLLPLVVLPASLTPERSLNHKVDKTFL